MKNAFVRFGRTCVSGVTALVIGGGLMAGALMAAQQNRITVTLPHSVTIGATTLPSGTYTISTVEMANEDLFIVRGENPPLVTLHAVRIDPDPSGKTQLEFTQDGAAWHFDKMFVAGDGTGYQFVDTK